jgi:hypothetical protein
MRPCTFGLVVASVEAAYVAVAVKLVSIFQAEMTIKLEPPWAFDVTKQGNEKLAGRYGFLVSLEGNRR